MNNIASKLFMPGGIGPIGQGMAYLKYAWRITFQGESLLTEKSVVAKTCELPRWSTDTQVINVYNHKTLVQTKLNYEPITMSFYDQTNNNMEALIWAHVNGQFDSTDGSKKAGLSPLEITIEMDNLSDTWAKNKVYTLKNAFIVDAQHDTLDYSTSDVVLWTLTIRYEDLVAEGFDKATPAVSTGVPPKPKPAKPVTEKVPVTVKPNPDSGIPFDGTTVWEAEGLPWTEAGGENGSGGAAFGNPSMTAQAARNRSKKPPTSTTPWPNSNNNPANNVSFDNNAQDPEAQTFVRPYNSSTGTSSSNIQSPASARQAADARAAYSRADPRRLDSAPGVSQDYKNAYAQSYAEQSAKFPPSAAKTPAEAARIERQNQNAARIKANATASKFTSTSRNTDVATTTPNLPGKEPASSPIREGTSAVNQKTNDLKGSAITSVQNQREATYKANPNSLDAIVERQNAKKAGVSVDQYRATQARNAQARASRIANATKNIDY